MIPQYAILTEDKHVTPVVFEEYNKNQNHADFPRRVGLTYITTTIFVSTVFLGINHGRDERPLWFETMVFGSEADEDQEHCETWIEAMDQHERIVQRVRGLK